MMDLSPSHHFTIDLFQHGSRHKRRASAVGSFDLLAPPGNDSGVLFVGFFWNLHHLPITILSFSSNTQRSQSEQGLSLWRARAHLVSIFDHDWFSGIICLALRPWSFLVAYYRIGFPADPLIEISHPRCGCLAYLPSQVHLRL